MTIILINRQIKMAEIPASTVIFGVRLLENFLSIYDGYLFSSDPSLKPYILTRHKGHAAWLVQILHSSHYFIMFPPHVGIDFYVYVNMLHQFNKKVPDNICCSNGK